MFDFLKSVMGMGKQPGMPPTEADSVTAREIAVDLKRLEAIGSELAQRTIAYVLTGEGSSILLQLEQRAKDVQSALSQYPHAGMAAATQAQVQAAIKARNNILVRQFGPQATWIRRYLEVLTLPHKGSRWGVFSHQGPSPFWLRGFLAQGELGLNGGQKRETDLNMALSWRDALCSGEEQPILFSQSRHRIKV
jgi:hypothetical protein